MFTLTTTPSHYHNSGIFSGIAAGNNMEILPAGDLIPEVLQDSDLATQFCWFGYIGFGGERADSYFDETCGDHFYNNELIEGADISYLGPQSLWGDMTGYTNFKFTEIYDETTNWVLCDYEDLKTDKILDTTVIVKGDLVTNLDDIYQIKADESEYVTVVIVPSNNNSYFPDFDLEILNSLNQVVASTTSGIQSGAVFIQFAVPGTQQNPINFKVRVSSPRVIPGKEGYILYITSTGEQDGPENYPVSDMIGGDHIISNHTSW